MPTIKIIVLLFGLLAFAGMLHAGCAQDAYSKACASCSFDTNGKIDKSCQQGYQSSGTACVSASYPIMTARYAQGKCPDVNACADELMSCTAQYATGDDKQDCQEGSVGICYAAADECTRKAAAACGDQVPCINAPAAFVLLVGASLFYYNKKN